MREAVAQARAMTPPRRAKLKALRGTRGRRGSMGGSATAPCSPRAQGIRSRRVLLRRGADRSRPHRRSLDRRRDDDGRRFRLDLYAGTGRPDPINIQDLGASEAGPKDAVSPASFSGQGAFTDLWSAFKSKLMSLAGRPYVFGGTDCAWLPHAALNSLPGTCSRARSYFDHDSACFTRCDAGPYLPGDLILMGHSEPDHWVVLSEVNDPRRANSPANKIIDQSSDCGGHCGENNVRPNLAARRVFACARPKALAAAAAADAVASRDRLIEARRSDKVIAAALSSAESLAR